MANIRSPAYPARLRQMLERETAGKEYQWTFDELQSFLRNWKGDRATTVEQRLRDLARMARHPVCPVRLLGTATQIVESFVAFDAYRRDIEHKAPTARVNDYRAMKALGTFLGIPREAWPKQPTVPRRARQRLPTPEDVRDCIQYPYVTSRKDNYERQLVKYLLVWDFAIAWRYPSEPFVARVQDLNVDEHVLRVTEPKKGYPTRDLLMDPEWLCCGHRVTSLANYLVWREKVDVGGTDALFLKPTGEPFRNRREMSDWLHERVQPHFPWFHGYMGRIWGLNARLIDTDFDFARVADWSGHESVDQLRRSYQHDARIHAKLFGRNWISRALGRGRNGGI